MTSCPPLPKRPSSGSRSRKGATLLRLSRLQFTSLSNRPQQALSRKIESRLLRRLRHRDRCHGGQGDERLEKHGFAENTLVVFSADNGPETHAFERLEEFKQWSSGKYRGVKRDIYEGGHRVPFIVKWPGKIKPGSVSDEVVSQVDLAASFAKIIGHRLGKKEAIDSYDLLPVLKGEKYDKPLRVATVQNTSPKKFALRQGDWVYINAPTGAAKRKVPPT